MSRFIGVCRAKRASNARTRSVADPGARGGFRVLASLIGRVKFLPSSRVAELVLFRCRGHLWPRLQTEISGSRKRVKRERGEDLRTVSGCPPSQAGAQPRGPGRENRHDPGQPRTHRGRATAKHRDVEAACGCARCGALGRRGATPCDRGPGFGTGDPGRSSLRRSWHLGGRGIFRHPGRRSVSGVAPGLVRCAGRSSGNRRGGARGEPKAKEESGDKEARDEERHPGRSCE